MRRVLVAAIALALVAGAIWAVMSRPEDSAMQADEATLPLWNFALNLDPKTMAETESRKVATLLFATLITTNAASEIEPRLASAWEQRGENTFVFKLREGLTFTNGKVIDADAVIASLCASMQPDHVQSSTLQQITHEKTPDGTVKCTGLQATDAITVEVNFTGPAGWLLDALSGPGGWIVDAASEAGEYGIRPGSGPYALSSVRPDNEIVLEARTRGSPISPGFARVRFVYLADSSLAAQYFNSGRLDLLEVTSPTVAASVLTENGAALREDASSMSFPADAVRVLVVNRHRLADRNFSAEQIVAIMRTLSASIPRERIAGASRGLASPLLTGFLPADVSAVDAESPREMAAEPFPRMTVLAETDPYSDRIAAAIANSEPALGLDYRSVEKGLLINAILNSEFDLALIRVEATWKSPRFWAAFFTPGNGFAAFGHPIEGFTAIDFGAPGSIQQAAALVKEEGNWIGVVRERGLVLRSARITGIRITSTGQLSLEAIEPSR